MLRKRSRSTSLPRVSSLKRRKIQDWIEDTAASQQGFSRASWRRAESDSGVGFSLECPDPSTGRKRQRLTKGILGPTVSDPHINPKISEVSSSKEPPNASKDSDEGIKPTDPKYQYYLEKRGVRLDTGYGYRPANLEDLKDIMAKARGSPGPSAEYALDFVYRAVECENEASAMQALLPMLLPIIEKVWSNHKIDATFVKKAWYKETLSGIGLGLLPDLQPKIAPPQPDQCFGFKGAVFPYPKATALLEGYVFPVSRLAWPYFSVEVTEDSGSAIMTPVTERAQLCSNVA